MMKIKIEIPSEQQPMVPALFGNINFHFSLVFLRNKFRHISHLLFILCCSFIQIYAHREVAKYLNEIL